MTQDYEVARNIWESKIPVEFILECDGPLEQPKPFYAMLPRIGYFSLILPKVATYFSSICGEVSLELDKLWLEYSRIPLKLYYPIGVIFDMVKSDSLLPWTISVKVKEAPLGAENVGKDTIETMFMQSLKEADYLRSKAEVINGMRSEEHKQLWRGLATENFDQFWSINRRLVDSSESDKIIYLPLRLYQKGLPVRQGPVAPLKQSGETRTLKDAIEIIDPSLAIDKCRIISHGIELPLDTPLTFLTQSVAYPDNFVHLVAVV